MTNDIERLQNLIDAICEDILEAPAKEIAEDLAGTAYGVSITQMTEEVLESIRKLSAPPKPNEIAGPFLDKETGKPYYLVAERVEYKSIFDCKEEPESLSIKIKHAGD